MSHISRWTPLHRIYWIACTRSPDVVRVCVGYLSNGGAMLTLALYFSVLGFCYCFVAAAVRYTLALHTSDYHPFCYILACHITDIHGSSYSPIKESKTTSHPTILTNYTNWWYLILYTIYLNHHTTW